MKKLFTFVFTMVLGATMAFAQGTAGSTDKAPATTTKAKKHHKGGHHKKGKKNDPNANTGATNPK